MTVTVGSIGTAPTPTVATIGDKRIDLTTGTIWRNSDGRTWSADSRVNDDTLAALLTAPAALTYAAAHTGESWHTVGAVGEPAFLSTWVNFDSTTTTQYRMDTAGNVHVRGIVKSGTGPVFALPSAYRPSTWAGAIVDASPGLAFLEVSPFDGQLYLTDRVGTPTRYSLNIVFAKG